MSGFFQYDTTIEHTPRREDDVAGFDVEATDGSIGKVIAASDEPGANYLVVDTGGWLLSKKVVLPAGVVRSIDRDGKKVQVDRSKDEIKSAPEFDEERYRQGEYRDELARHYTRR
jgi:hypothetical protein